MGKPSTPTTASRLATQRLAAAAIASVVEDKAMPGIQSHRESYLGSNQVCDRSDVEDLVMQLALEISALRQERDEAIDLAEEANGDPSSCSYNVLIGDRLRELRGSK